MENPKPKKKLSTIGGIKKETLEKFNDYKYRYERYLRKRVSNDVFLNHVLESN